MIVNVDAAIKASVLMIDHVLRPIWQNITSEVGFQFITQPVQLLLRRLGKCI